MYDGHMSQQMLAERIGAPIHGEPFAARYPLPAAHPLWRGPLPGFAADIRHILEAEGVPFEPAAVRLVAIAADGSMRFREGAPREGVLLGDHPVRDRPRGRWRRGG